MANLIVLTIGGNPKSVGHLWDQVGELLRTKGATTVKVAGSMIVEVPTANPEHHGRVQLALTLLLDNRVPFSVRYL